MNNPRFNKAIEELHALRMNPQEKSALYASLQAKIGAMQAAGGAVSEGQPVPSPFTRTFSFQEWMGGHRFASAAVAVFAIVVLGGGGATFAAAGSLPGDALYPMKVSLIEPIRGAVSVSAESRASYQAELVSTRLAEASQLETEGRFDDTKRSQIQTLIAAHSQAFQEAAIEAPASQQIMDASLAIEQGVTFLAASQGDINTIAGVPVAATASLMVSATATEPASAAARAKTTGNSAAPTLLNVTTADIEIKAAGGAGVIPATAPHSSPATTSSSTPGLPHINDIQTVKNVIQETAAVLNAVSEVPTAAASTIAPTTDIGL